MNEAEGQKWNALAEERDALRAEVERLRDAIDDAVQDLRGYGLGHLDPVAALGVALGGEDG